MSLSSISINICSLNLYSTESLVKALSILSGSSISSSVDGSQRLILLSFDRQRLNFCRELSEYISRLNSLWNSVCFFFCSLCLLYMSSLSPLSLSCLFHSVANSTEWISAAGLDYFGWICFLPLDDHKTVAKSSHTQISIIIMVEPTEDRGERAEREGNGINETQRVQDQHIRKKQSGASSLSPFD